MSDHTPEPCGCKVQWAYSDTHPPVIVYCPTHAAAPDRLAALEQIVEWDESEDHDGTHPFACMACQRIHHACAAIAKAKGEA